jgi:hypothetical protein
MRCTNVAYRYRLELISLGMLYANELLKSSLLDIAQSFNVEDVKKEGGKEEKTFVLFNERALGKLFSISTFYFIFVFKKIFFKLILLSSVFPFCNCFKKGKFDCIRCVYFKT